MLKKIRSSFYFKSAKDKMNQREYEAAILDFDQAIEINPQNAGAFYNRGLAKKVLGLYEAAILDFDQAIEIKPLYPEAFYNRGLAKKVLGLYEAAILDFDQDIQINPLHTAAFDNRGCAKHALGQHEDAILDFDRALEINPRDSIIFHNRGYIKQELGQYEAAILDFDRAIEINPQDAVAFHNRGTAKGNFGQYEAAIQDFDRAIEINPQDAEAFYKRGWIKKVLGLSEAAIQDFDQSIEIRPRYARAFYNRGRARYELGQYQAAILDYDQAIQINPQFAAAFNNRGRAKQELGQHPDARADFREAARFDPQYNRAHPRNRVNPPDIDNQPIEPIQDVENEIHPEQAIMPTASTLTAVGHFKPTLPVTSQLTKTEKAEETRELKFRVVDQAIADEKITLSDNKKNNYLCPISHTLMRNPIMTCFHNNDQTLSGNNHYDKSSLDDYKKTTQAPILDPISKKKIEESLFDGKLKNQIAEFVDKKYQALMDDNKQYVDNITRQIKNESKTDDIQIPNDDTFNLKSLL